MPNRAFRHFALQGAAIILVLSLAWPYFAWKAEPLPWRETSFAIGAAALALASIGRLSWPWRLAHAAAAPLAWTLDSCCS
jgi:hypothetical protein